MLDLIYYDEDFQNQLENAFYYYFPNFIKDHCTTPATCHLCSDNQYLEKLEQTIGYLILTFGCYQTPITHVNSVRNHQIVYFTLPYINHFHYYFQDNIDQLNSLDRRFQIFLQKQNLIEDRDYRISYIDRIELFYSIYNEKIRNL
jgi:hypothetical protein